MIPIGSILEGRNGIQDIEASIARHNPNEFVSWLKEVVETEKVVDCSSV